MENGQGSESTPPVSTETGHWNTLRHPISGGSAEVSSTRHLIESCRAHGISVLKTELDLEPLPWRCLYTNSLALQFGLLAQNILRPIGQENLIQTDAAVGSKRTRTRFGTVI